MVRCAAPLLGALLVWASLPVGGAAAGGARGAGCRMSCCTTGGGAGARPSSPPACRAGCGHGQQAGSIVESTPSLLAAPPRLPAPADAPFAARRPAPACIAAPPDLPERPPRA
jgi:hypothetical protein